MSMYIAKKYQKWTWGNIIEVIEDSRFGDQTAYFKTEDDSIHKVDIVYLGAKSGYDITLNDVDLGGDLNLGEAYDILAKCVVQHK